MIIYKTEHGTTKATDADQYPDGTLLGWLDTAPSLREPLYRVFVKISTIWARPNEWAELMNGWSAPLCEQRAEDLIGSGLPDGAILDVLYVPETVTVPPRPGHRIESLEELEALPIRTLLTTDDGWAVQKVEDTASEARWQTPVGKLYAAQVWNIFGQAGNNLTVRWIGSNDGS